MRVRNSTREECSDSSFEWSHSKSSSMTTTRTSPSLLPSSILLFSFSISFLLLILFPSFSLASVGSSPIDTPSRIQQGVNEIAQALLKQSSGPCSEPEFEEKSYTELCDEGIKLMQQNELSHGFTCFTKAFLIDTEAPRAAILISLGLKQIKNCEHAKYFLEYTNARNPKSAEIYTIFAQCHMGEDGLSNLEEVIEILNRGISYESTPLAFYELGNAYRKKGDVDSAVSTFQEAHSKFDLGDDVWYTEMGRALQDGKRFDEALIYMTFSVIEKPDNPHYHYNLASILEKMERFDDAISSLERCLEINPSILDARKRIGNIHLKAGRSKEALQSYKKAFEMAPEDDALKSVIASLEKPAFWDEVDEEIDGLDGGFDDLFEDDEEEGEVEAFEPVVEAKMENKKEPKKEEPKKEEPKETEEDEWW